MTRIAGIIALLAGGLLVACEDTGPIGGTPPLTDTDLTRVSALAASCSGCHAVSGGAIVDISNHTEAKLIETLQAYRNDADGTTVMNRLARGYSEDEIAAVAAYLGADAS